MLVERMRCGEGQGVVGGCGEYGHFAVREGAADLIGHAVCVVGTAVLREQNQNRRAPLPGERLHGAGARVMYAATMVYVLAAAGAWEPGGGSPRPLWRASGFLVLASAQVVLGVGHAPSPHLPLGVLVFALSVLALLGQLRVSPEPGRPLG
ncbi:hypothetical protein ACIRF8_35265 [Streptomyces sp. NPDC102406]|uniref:hypothetical protein n=1 Tax=Streptomyces sp. NPDC102406 TaxID=3366171 RepID=UPI00381C1261